MAHVSRLLIIVPKSRRACGRATLVARDGSALLPPLRILATASAAVARKHGNPSRDRSLPFGHPPQGSYVFAGSVPPGFWPKPRRARRFGQSGAVLLTPQSGEARTAAKNGRRLFYLHGGPSDRKGRLRPTRGGFRMLDQDLTLLLSAINDAHLRGDPLDEIEVTDVRLPARPAPVERALTRRRREGGKLRKARTLRDTPAGSLSVSPKPPRFGALTVIAPALALAAKLLGKGTPDARGAISRRHVLALALVISTVTGCGDDDDPPSGCRPVACDPGDGSCPPDGCYSGVPSSPWGGGGGIVGTTGPIADDTGGDG